MPRILQVKLCLPNKRIKLREVDLDHRPDFNFWHLVELVAEMAPDSDRARMKWQNVMTEWNPLKTAGDFTTAMCNLQPLSETKKESVDEMKFVVGLPFFLLLKPLPRGHSVRLFIADDAQVTPTVLFAHISKYFPHRDLTKPVRWKDTDGDLCMVPPWDLDNWKEAILVTRHMVKALNGPGRVTLEVFVDVLESVSVRYTYAVPALAELAVNAVARLVPNKGAVDKLEVSKALKPTIRKEADFLANAGSKTVRVHLTAVLDK